MTRGSLESAMFHVDWHAQLPDLTPIGNACHDYKQQLRDDEYSASIK